MTLPYETATSGDRALDELARILSKFGCHRFGWMIDRHRGVTIVQFAWQERMVSLEASWAGYAAALRRAQPRKSRSRVSAAEQERRFLEQAQISVCSVLRDWAKAQVTAIECGTLTFEAAFLAHIHLPSGERIIERLQADHLLPTCGGSVMAGGYDDEGEAASP